ncbi:hypothetical protein [uncultured Mediterranean phage uvMED]|nr:hypothetical protein [uncultured Mediterranean phage uvMED]BAQ84519.1 hypothetical protein [uncultured Mediterranean phage uvMED]
MPTLITGVDNDDKYRTVRVGDDGHLGSSKSDYLNGPGTLNGNYSWVFANASTVLSSVTSPNMTGTLTNIEIPAGSTWRCCSATQLVVGSGAITAYYV